MPTSCRALLRHYSRCSSIQRYECRAVYEPVRGNRYGRGHVRHASQNAQKSRPRNSQRGAWIREVDTRGHVKSENKSASQALDGLRQLADAADPTKKARPHSGHGWTAASQQTKADIENATVIAGRFSETDSQALSNVVPSNDSFPLERVSQDENASRLHPDEFQDDHNEYTFQSEMTDSAADKKAASEDTKSKPLDISGLGGEAQAGSTLTERSPLYRKWSDNFAGFLNRVKPDQILYISGANKNLTERDFVRITLKDSRHLPVARIIPIRDPATLEKRDDYILIFPNRVSLEEWRDQAHHLGLLARKYTMRSLSHPEIAPQQGFSIKGEKIDQLVKSYALMPAASSLQTNWNPTETNFKRMRIAQAGGDELIVDSKGRRRSAVLLRITGVHDLRAEDLLQSIMYDGKVRNMVWDIKVDPHLDLTKGASKTTPNVTANSQGPESDGNSSVVDDIPGANERGPSGLSDLLPSEEAVRHHDGARWVVYFNRQMAAARFARTWHCRPLPLPENDDPEYEFSEQVRQIIERPGGNSTRVSAELLW